MNYAHVVIAATAYEGFSLVKIFADAKDAAVFVDRCRAYEGKRPETLDADAPDKQFQVAWERFERWQKKHPAGEYNHGCDYSVVRMPLISARIQKTVGDAP